MALLRYVSDGFRTAIELDGIGIGEGIEAMEFNHACGEPATLNLKFDLNKFQFLHPGDFDKVEKEMADMTKYLISKGGKDNA